MGFKSSRENTDETDSESSRSVGSDESAKIDRRRKGSHSSETTNSDSSLTGRSIQRTSEWLGDEGSSVTAATIESTVDNITQDGSPVTDATIERTVDKITDHGLAVTDAVPGWQDKVEELKNPPGVPADIDHFNNRSVQRSRIASHETGPAGETQVPDSVREVISSSGQSLDPSIQRTMEDRMGDSLGDVRIHTGATAANACESINARAFTVGNHVAFNAGEYDPGSPEGQHVLAHELAHVRQQTGGALSMLPQADLELEIDPDPALEREAEETAQRVMAGGELGIQRLRSTDVHVQRIPDGHAFEALALFQQENNNQTVEEFQREQNQRRINYLQNEVMTAIKRRQDIQESLSDVESRLAAAQVDANLAKGDTSHPKEKPFPHSDSERTKGEILNRAEQLEAAKQGVKSALDDINSEIDTSTDQIALTEEQRGKLGDNIDWNSVGWESTVALGLAGLSVWATGGLSLAAAGILGLNLSFILGTEALQSTTSYNVEKGAEKLREDVLEPADHGGQTKFDIK